MSGRCSRALQTWGAGEGALVDSFGGGIQKVYQGVGATAFSSLDEQGLLDEAARVAVKKRNKLVNRLKLYDMKQEEDKAITSFETRVKPVARTGKFKVE